NWMFGVGQPGYEQYTFSHFGSKRSAHNLILQLLAYSGSVGLLLFSIFLYAVFMQSFRFYFRFKLLLPMLLVIPVFGIILSSHLLYNKLAWVVLAYCGSRIFYRKINAKSSTNIVPR